MFILGIDVGTTGTKAMALDENGRVAGRGYCEYALHMPQSDRVEQDAEDWWRAVVAAVRAATAELDAGAVRAIGLSTQGASMLAVNGDGDPLCPVITWMDRRAAAESEELVAALGEEALYRKAGWAPSPTLDAPKIAWLRRHRPEIYAQADSFVSTLEFINRRLTGRCAVDPTNAAIRQLIDVEAVRYDADILGFLGLDEGRLPELLPSGGPVGTLTAAAADALGLPRPVMVYNGAHDQYCAAIGSGVHRPGDMLLATGTTWVVLGVTGQPLYTASRLSPGRFPLTGQYAAMLSMVSAGSALKWWKTIAGGSYADIDREAAGRMESAAGLLAYPYVAGASRLHAAETTARLDGLTLRHDQYDIARSLMEGVAFEARLLLEEFARQGMPMHTLVMTGGAANSHLWSEITGYITGCRIVHTGEPEAACLGAAMLAAVGEGWYPTLAACSDAMVQTKPFPLPDDEGQCVFYEDKFRRYCARWG